jgi:hypothetical protein
MSMNDGFWVALGAVAMALINSTASVLMLWIRARYQWRNGNGSHGAGDVQPPYGP